MANFNFDQIPSRRGTNSEKWTHFPDDVLPFWVADMDFQAPPAVREALAEAVAHGIFGYASPSMKLKETVTSRMEKLYGWKFDPQAVIATPGIVSAFNAAAKSLCEPGDGYVIQPPVYMPFNYLQETHGFIRQEALLFQMMEEKRLRYNIDWESFSRAFHSNNCKTRMFLLCNPHNPTGQVYSKEELLKMAGICLEKDAVIVSDEIHSELLLGGVLHNPIAALSPEIAKRSITLIAPSKTFNVPGLYCGFAIIPDEEIRSRYKQAMERMTMHINSLGLVAAEAAFSGACDLWLDELKLYLTENRDYVLKYLDKQIPAIRSTVPEATYLAWFDCSELGQENPQKFFLKEAKVALNNGASFGTGGNGFVRFNFGTSRSMLEEGLTRMKKAIEKDETK